LSLKTLGKRRNPLTALLYRRCNRCDYLRVKNTWHNE
jgi:hypothetical protein